MATNIVVPALGESVVEATVARWLKNEGDAVRSGEALVELETDKVDLEVPAESDGVLTKITRQAGEDVQIGDVLGVLDASAAADASEAKADGAENTEPDTAEEPAATASADKSSAKAEPAPAQAPTPTAEDAPKGEATPVAKRMAADSNVDLRNVSGSGPGGRVTKEDVERFVQQSEQTPAPQQRPAAASSAPAADPRGEERIPMSRRRRTIAQRLVEAQQTAAMLTTFNELDMTAVMDIRKRRRESFAEQHGVGLGFTSFFVKAAIGALKAFPPINGEIQGNDIVLKPYYDIGIAVGAEEGLVVPVLRNADRLSFAQIEQQVKDFVQKSRDGALSIDDLRGGTFTITNGGVFGSLLSTPILNPPQVGILGLHKIEERPVVVTKDGAKEIAIRPMMYVALSYDHRMVDGREAVQFLVKVKELIEDPETLLLEG
ncbi:MAG: 2-oxoglutarate dehydrogenase complex dihydrolipoyllysine-residue succinyltransferase [Caldilineaceae bacterium]|nr:2-oxoglutarate dehydrogenase complex dihydrolipoyllysine-residue succinyltransferase [Caldilineaceae bacterium]MCB0140358.1 2-oxoglutarate dehydrogenase complex dihydrolipoyllysine-residue succinyltransferase [Caldilineaceae bacterium]MCB9157742.1 2-oxoglutarate dehydrogenase complex dihydrolipoyllysine-residue succinyltransferase [Caldilineaceae bacterium]